MQGVFVTGTDTGVGKTIICAGLLKILHGAKPATYWKPIQTGTIVGDDTTEVKKLTQFSAEAYLEPCYKYPEPLPPYLAGEKWGKPIELETLIKAYPEEKKNRFLIVEGAGGLLLPLNDRDLQIDLIRAFGLPLLIVAEDRVGAINQVLLTLNACRDEKLPVHGVILTKSKRLMGNAQAIRRFGKVDVIAEFDPSDDVRNIFAQVGADPGLRNLFKINHLPN